MIAVNSIYLSTVTPRAVRQQLLAFEHEAEIQAIRALGVKPSTSSLFALRSYLKGAFYPEVKIEAIKQIGEILLNHGGEISTFDYGLSIAALKLLVHQNERVPVIRAAAVELNKLGAEIEFK
jgi:hypothetical protein